MLILGMVVGVVIMATAYVITMYAYFKARQKYSEAKYMVEIFTVVFAVVFSVAIKLVINLINSPESFTQGFSSLLHAIYSTIGGLTFEGLADLGDVGNGLVQCLYTASSLYAGIIVLSVITTKASYEIYCGLKLRFLSIKLRTNKKFAQKTDLYIFTSATQDSVILAESIKEKYQTEKTDRRCEIIFTGELGVFSKEDDVHREIMADGFLFWSYVKKIDEEKESSILKRLNLYIDNCFYKENCTCPNSRIHIFAFNNNEGLSGLESENGNIVFGEMKALLKEFSYSKKKVFVDFYLLVDNDINYEIYKSKMDNLKQEYVNLATQLENNNRNKGLKDCFPFILHLINEADYSSKNLIKKRDELFTSLLPTKNLFKGVDTYRTMVIGFGQTGQTATMQTFINTSNVTNRVPDKFVADVFDIEIDKVGGLFLLRHPLVDGRIISGDLQKGIKDEEKHSKIFTEKLNRIYSSIYSKEEIKALDGDVSKDLTLKMTFPIVNMYKTSCFGSQFMNYFDNVAGAKIVPKYDLVIISLGDDEMNIAMANALLGDIRNELEYCKNTSKFRDLTIAINVRDKNNISRIDWGEKEDKLFDLVHVIKFGFAEEIYSYDAIVDDVPAMMYSYPYALLEQDSINDVYMDLVKKHNEIIAKDGFDDTDYTPNLEQIFNHLNKNHDIKDIRKNWTNGSLFDRESNNSVAMFSTTMKVLCQDIKFTYENMSWLVDIEHERWDRFHIANGWVFKEKKYKPYRQHDCIVPTEKLKDEFGKYDLVNAVRSIFEK